MSDDEANNYELLYKIIRFNPLQFVSIKVQKSSKKIDVVFPCTFNSLAVIKIFNN